LTRHPAATTLPVAVVEVSPFEARADAVWSDEERHAFIDFIAWNPLAGDEIPGTGGVRKVRWSRRGAGKRGGVRVIYYFYNERRPVYLLTVYPKAKQDDLTPEQRKIIVRIVAEIRAEFGLQSRRRG
jgi:mRNA-degrading endonuclease RelE of RelBE toxin-antitoxin system